MPPRRNGWQSMMCCRNSRQNASSPARGIGILSMLQSDSIGLRGLILLVRFIWEGRWMERVRDRIDVRPRADDHPMPQRVLGAPTMSAVVGAVANALSIDENSVRYGRGGAPRMIAAWIGFHEALLPVRDIAAGLRLRSSGYVSNLISRCDRELNQDPFLRGCVDRCLATIGREKKKRRPDPITTSS